VLVLVRDGTGVVVASADTEADGSYTVRGLPSGAYQVLFEPTAAESRVVRAYADQAYNSGATVSVTAPATVTGVDAALQRRAAAGQVFGTVTGANTGAPLEGVPVVVRNLAGVVLAVVYTDAQGAYSTGDLPAGIYRATFLPQFSPLAATSTYAPQDSAPVDVPLGRPARIDAVLAPRS
jgi:large repetitive protein